MPKASLIVELAAYFKTVLVDRSTPTKRQAAYIPGVNDTTVARKFGIERHTVSYYRRDLHGYLVRDEEEQTAEDTIESLSAEVRLLKARSAAMENLLARVYQDLYEDGEAFRAAMEEVSTSAALAA